MSVDEMAGRQNPLQAALDAGLDVLSQSVEITFVKYLRIVLPLDGFVFWIKAALVSPSAVPDIMRANFATPNAPRIAQPPEDAVDLEDAEENFAGPVGVEISAQGALHYTTTKNQNVDETIAINRVVFTSEVEVQELNDVAPGVMFIGEFEGQRFAFSQRQSFFRQANIFHYVGDAIYPAMATQIIDENTGLDVESLVVSNSLPYWLGFAKLFPLYPSFAVPDNVAPPYGVIDIKPEDTEALQPVPSYDRLSSHAQLASDKVTVIIYGRRNNEAMDFYDFVISQLALDNTMGLMAGAIMRDEKRVQTELGILAMKKRFEFKVSYYQARARDFARQLITRALVGTWYFSPDGQPSGSAT